MDVLPPGAPACTTGDLEADTDAFYDALTALIRLYMLRNRERVCSRGLSVTECYALDAVVRLGALTVTGLAGEMGLNKSTASRVADALEARGLVERRRDLENYRVRLLVPTGTGAALNDEVVADVKAEHRALLAGFDYTTRAETVRLLHAVTAAAAPRIRAAGSACCTDTGS